MQLVLPDVIMNLPKPAVPLASEAAGVSPLLQRFDTLDLKLDLLLTYIQLLEGQSDQHWRGVESGTVQRKSGQGAGGDLCALGTEFRELMRQAEKIERLRSDVADGRPMPLEIDQVMAAKLDPILARLSELGEKIATLPATSDADMSVKALAIAGLGEENSDDIVHRLAASLSGDILARAAEPEVR